MFESRSLLARRWIGVADLLELVAMRACTAIPGISPLPSAEALQLIVMAQGNYVHEHYLTCRNVKVLLAAGKGTCDHRVESSRRAWGGHWVMHSVSLTWVFEGRVSFSQLKIGSVPGVPNSPAQGPPIPFSKMFGKKASMISS